MASAKLVAVLPGGKSAELDPNPKLKKKNYPPPLLSLSADHPVES
jgi:hypothetical protein